MIHIYIYRGGGGYCLEVKWMKTIRKKGKRTVASEEGKFQKEEAIDSLKRRVREEQMNTLG